MTQKEIIDISEDNGILVCTIKVPPRNHAFKKTVIYRTNSVIEMLITKGYDIDTIMESTLVHNKPTKGNTYEGTWKFKLAAKKTTRKTTKSRSKTNK